MCLNQMKFDFYYKEKINEKIRVRNLLILFKDMNLKNKHYIFNIFDNVTSYIPLITWREKTICLMSDTKIKPRKFFTSKKMIYYKSKR